MADLLFEVWSDADEGIDQMIMVHPQGDKIRLATIPNAICVHSFTAQSNFEAFRQKDVWHGFDPWEDGGISEELFSANKRLRSSASILVSGTSANPWPG